MAAVASPPSRGPSRQGSRQGQKNVYSPPGSACSARPAAEVRFKDVAHFVGVSSVRTPPGTQGVPKGQRLPDLDSEHLPYDPFPLTPTMEPAKDMLRAADLTASGKPGRSERLRCQLEWLRSEQEAERHHIKKLDTCLSDSALIQKKAQQRIAKHQELRGLHVNRVQEVDTLISNIKHQLTTCEAAPRRLQSREHMLESLDTSVGLTGSHCSSAKTSPPPTADTVGSASPGLLALSTERAAKTDSSLRSWTEDFPGSTPVQPGAGLAPLAATSKQSRRRPASTPAPEEFRPAKLSGAEEQEMREAWRENVRMALKDKAGSARAAFNKLDLNGSGRISSQEFADGISRLGVIWQDLTGFQRPRDLFNLFDQDKDFSITFQELFPEETTDGSARPSTPDFCRAYVRNRAHSDKVACWQPSNPDEELEFMRHMSDRGDEAAEKRKWMRSTMRRLKTRGKSDARCREVVAGHLPRGSGPKDREGVNTFTKVDLKNCKKAYTDDVNLPMRRMWKVFMGYKEQKKEQKRVYERLYSVTEALVQKQKTEESLNSLAGLFAKKDEGQSMGPGASSATASKASAEASEAEEIRKDYAKFADTGDNLPKRGFCRLVQTLLPGKVVAESMTDVWWTEASKEDIARHASVGSTEKLANQVNASIVGGGIPKPGGSRGSHIDFRQFCEWWFASEARQL